MASKADFEIQITALSTAHFTEPFPAPDKLVAMFVVEATGATGLLTVTPQHSNDGGRSWIPKSNIVTTASFTGTAVTPIFGADDGTVPNMELMRLSLLTTVSTPNIRIFLHSRSY